ncbi:hypothetical protein [Vibrio atypicus]|uniref:hypothetical protein n=1 Tax=Vibrio atypicus TaxID=558271 RepID=UPI0037357498
MINLKHLFNLEKVDVSLLLRAISIFSIVAGHFHWIGVPGGAYYLIFLSGFNFILFTSPKVSCLNYTSKSFNSSEFYSTYFSFVWKIILPTLLYTIFLFLFLDVFYPASIILISNFIAPMYGEGLSFWFIEVLLQIYLLFAIVFYTNKYWFWFKKYAYESFLILFVLFFFISLICRLVWDTSELLDRLPHLMLYIFLAGSVTALSKSFKKKILTTFVLSLILLDIFVFGFNSRIIFLYLGALMTIWLPYILMPKVFSKVVFYSAISSLFIYLTHFQTLSLLGKISMDQYPGVNVFAAFSVGVLITQIWKRREKIFYILSLGKLSGS